MENALKGVCKKCTDATFKVYFRNVKRLYKLVSDKTPPDSATWLMKPALMTKFKKEPLKIRRHLSVAGLKLAKAYDLKKAIEIWSAQMTSDSDAYKKERGKRELSDTEKKNIPTKGWASVRKLANEFKRRRGLSSAYNHSTYVLLRLMSEVPLRNTAATLEIVDTGKNNFVDVPKKGVAKLVIRNHKSVKSVGERTISVSRGLTTVLRKYLKNRNVDNKSLLVNKQEKPLSKSALGKVLHRVSEQIIGKRFGSRLIRIMAARSKSEAMKEIEALSKVMLHKNTSETRNYAKS